MLLSRLVRRGFHTLRETGWKHDAWHDVAWMQLRVGDETRRPTPRRG